MYGGTSVNRNYQSTGRKVSSGEGNLELYAHRKNQSKKELVAQEKRRGWNGSETKNAKELAMLQRYNSIEIQKRNPLENSLPPKEKNKRGMSILNREKNNFVRDVSERVKREPLTRLKSIGLYQGKGDANEYEFQEEKGGKEENEKGRSKSKIKGKETEKKSEGQKTPRQGKKSRDFEKKIKKEKHTSIDKDAFFGEEKKKSQKSETLKHLKRRNNKKKKRDVSSKKKADKVIGEAKKKEKGGKKKNHQSSLSSKIDRNLELNRSKKSSIQEINDKKSKKKKARKASESTSKIMKKRKKELKNNKNLENSKNVYTSGEGFMNSFYTERKDKSKAQKKKKTKKFKNNLKSSKEGRKGKLFKIGKKMKESANEMTSKERKRYLSVNTNKNILLDKELMTKFNPRKTLNAKTISLKKEAFKSNDIQKTDLFTYKFKRDASIKEAKSKGNKTNSKKRENALYASQGHKRLQGVLYQRNNSQVSSENDENQQGLYKNLYSGRHEKNILEFNSNKSRGYWEK